MYQFIFTTRIVKTCARGSNVYKSDASRVHVLLLFCVTPMATVTFWINLCMVYICYIYSYVDDIQSFILCETS